MNVYDKLTKQFGRPERTIFMASIAAKPGIEYLLEQIPGCNIYAAAIDPELDDRGFIVPGLGDAGNLCYNGGMSHLN